METIAHDFYPSNNINVLAEQRRRYIAAITPRPTVAVAAATLAAVVGPRTRSRGVIAIMTEDLSTAIDLCRFSSRPGDKDLMHQLSLTSLIDQRTRWLSIAAAKDGNEITWGFICPALFNRCSERYPAALLWPSNENDLICRCQARRSRPAFVLPTRMLAFAEPDRDAA